MNTRNESQIPQPLPGLRMTSQWNEMNDSQITKLIMEKKVSLVMMRWLQNNMISYYCQDQCAIFLTDWPEHSIIFFLIFGTFIFLIIAFTPIINTNAS